MEKAKTQQWEEVPVFEIEGAATFADMKMHPAEWAPMGVIIELSHIDPEYKYLMITPDRDDYFKGKADTLWPWVSKDAAEWVLAVAIQIKGETIAGDNIAKRIIVDQGLNVDYSIYACLEVKNDNGSGAEEPKD